MDMRKLGGSRTRNRGTHTYTSKWVQADHGHEEPSLVS
uniref:Uncharacterized protein n=1 Tax=Arundo donax TaxID=35708 RepID=A0A0A9EHQ2_ARUDO